MRKSPVNRVNRKRKAANDARAYGSKAQRAFVAGLPCAACGIEGYSQNAHVLGNGGMSRKAEAETVAPLCGPRPWFIPLLGCHRLFDEHRQEFDEMFPEFNPERAAAECQSAWLAASQGTPTRRTEHD